MHTYTYHRLLCTIPCIGLKLVLFQAPQPAFDINLAYLESVQAKAQKKKNKNQEKAVAFDSCFQ